MIVDNQGKPIGQAQPAPQMKITVDRAKQIVVFAIATPVQAGNQAKTMITQCPLTFENATKLIKQAKKLMQVPVEGIVTDGTTEGTGELRIADDDDDAD